MKIKKDFFNKVLESIKQVCVYVRVSQPSHYWYFGLDNPERGLYIVMFQQHPWPLSTRCQ